MNFDELRKRCESEIEKHLLGALYPELGPDAQKEIQAQLYDRLLRHAGDSPRFRLP